jgi:subtilisin family serine protease
MPRRLVLASFAFALACATAPAPTTAPQPTPQPAPAATPTPAPDVVTPAVPLFEAPRDWQLLDEKADHVAGISARRAERELLAGRTPKRTVVVAVIDGGVDTAHVDLRGVLWTNPKETPGNRVDDDRDGYVDDVHGWNFIGGASGDVDNDTYEVTRIHARCLKRPAGGNLPAPDAAQCAAAATEYQTRYDAATRQSAAIRQIRASLDPAVALLARTLGDSVTVDRVRGLRPADAPTRAAQQIYLGVADNIAPPAAVAQADTSYAGQLKYSFNLDFNPRTVVGDHYADVSERRYGNADVTGPDALHGTHVAGIIGAMRNGSGIDGVATSVRIMSVRTVPDGDERDKDVANAIRYAVDAGANVINMSFGKSYSPQKAAVDEAVKYADAHGVLMVHAAGNENADLATAQNFPTPAYLGGGRPANWIEVGASSWQGGAKLAAPFSNYGSAQVDVFAPGVDILSTVQGGGYARESGTSMAAPVVTGLAAVLMSYFPDLSAADVKRVILESAVKHADQRVLRPGSDSESVAFGTLSATGAIVNEFEAVKMADELTRPKP